MIGLVNEVTKDTLKQKFDLCRPWFPPKTKIHGAYNMSEFTRRNAVLCRLSLVLLAPPQVHQLEFILDSLVDEKDRSTQKRGETATGRAAGVGAGHGSATSASDGSSQLSLEISVSRPAEIEAALQQFVSPKVGPSPREVNF